MKNNNRLKILNLILIILLILQIVAPTFSNAIQIKNNDLDVIVENEEADYYYISDMNYITENNWSYTGYGNIMKDKNTDGGKISLLIEGKRVYFSKGMGAHAS